MKLYKLSQSYNTGYDTYSDCVVCAESSFDALTIHPSGDSMDERKNDIFSTWAPIEVVTVEFIGIAKEGLKRGVICASFHAG